MLRKTAPVVAGLALVVSLAGCGGDDPAPDAGPTDPPAPASSPADPSPSQDGPTRPTSATPSPSRDGAPFEADLRPDTGGVRPGAGNGLTLTEVRVGRQDGFDRVVFQLDGTGRPGWRVEYVDVPRADGSGEELDLRGDSFLQVDLRNMGLPSDTGVEEVGPEPVEGDGTRSVTEVLPGGVFEGQQLAFVGLAGERRPFRVFALDSPTRVVVDVVHG
ncbi:AMIN-like domain-containing (lipo)protein [Nocardioides marmoraquaticus]